MMQSLPEMDHFLTCVVPEVQGLRGRVISSPPTVCRQVIRAASEVSARTRSIRLSRGYQEPGTQHQHQLKFNLCWTGRKERKLAGRGLKPQRGEEVGGSSVRGGAANSHGVLKQTTLCSDAVEYQTGSSSSQAQQQQVLTLASLSEACLNQTRFQS